MSETVFLETEFRSRPRPFYIAHLNWLSRGESFYDAVSGYEGKPSEPFLVYRRRMGGEKAKDFFFSKEDVDDLEGRLADKVQWLARKTGRDFRLENPDSLNRDLWKPGKDDLLVSIERYFLPTYFEAPREGKA